MAKNSKGNSSEKNPVGNTGFPTVTGSQVKTVSPNHKILTGKDLRATASGGK